MEGLPWVEYAVIVASLIGTCLIGLHFSRSKYKSLEDYVLGGRRMTVLPIALSTAATMLTGASFISCGQEHYLYGCQLLIFNFCMIPVAILAAYFYLPVFYKLRSVSLYEYFDRRFSSVRVRKLISALSILETIQAVVVSLYVPSLTLSQASGLPLFPLACALSLLSFIYTVKGGLKAVAWADSFQMAIIIVVSFAFFGIGTHEAGGWTEIVRKNDEGFRMKIFNFDPSPFQRVTFFTNLGSVIIWVSYYLSPTIHQRFNALPNLKKAQQAMMWSSILVMVVVTVHIMFGFPVYAYYAGCDPVLAKKGITSYANIVPYFIKEISQGLPGLTGLFHAGIIAAGLSTTTSYWNTTGCTIYEDLIKPYLKVERQDEKTSFRIIMWLVSILAVLSTVGVYFIQNVGTILETVLVMRALNYSSCFILFNAGLFFPWVTAKGVVAGAISTSITLLITTVGHVWVRKNGYIRDNHLILTTANCTTNSTLWFPNATTSITTGLASYGAVTEVDDEVFWLFKLSIFLLTVPGIVVGLVVAVAYSFLTGPQNLETLDPEMIVPQLRWLLPTSADNSKDRQKRLDYEMEEVNMQINRRKNSRNIEHEAETLIS